MRCRREHLVGALVLAWTGSAHAAEEDIVIAHASHDLSCNELRMMHSGDQYAVSGCGHMRRYECTNGVCSDVTHRVSGANPDGACVAQVIGATALVGCACLGVIASKSPPAPNFVQPGALDACR